MNHKARMQFVAVSLLVILSNVPLVAQLAGDQDQLMNGRQQNQGQSQLQYQQNLQNLKLAMMEGPIDPKEYLVGPGDIYSVNIWVSPPLNFEIPVTPEGTVIIPTVGEVDVAGMHLDEAKEKVLRDIRRRYVGGTASFTLLVPRIFAVTVQGVVKNEGTVYVQAGERVDEAIALANTTQTATSKEQGLAETGRRHEPYLIVKRDSVGSLRRILVRHKDGTSSQVDLERYFIRKDSKYNPLLLDGDVVIVPRLKTETDFIGVYGAVNREGTFEFVPGDSVVSAVEMAKGLSVDADSGAAELYRPDETGDSLHITKFNLRTVLAHQSSDIALRPGDRVIVKARVDLRRDSKVYIEGAIRRPGYYPITRDSTTLSSLVGWAGGFRDDANLSASRILRKDRSSDRMWERLENARGNTRQEDSVTYQLESNIRMDEESVGADFVGIFQRNDRTKDIYLHDGDHIIIAVRKGAVYVFGEVVQPGYVEYAPNKDFEYYLGKAGGITVDGIHGGVRVIKAGSRQWLSPSETTIDDGDYVWVPKEPYRPLIYYMQVYTTVFGILGTLATIAVLVVQVTK
ncbi:MAG TPA: SLBB domain-containing protein [Bacteroidota bacterium]|nr:SLBB domain-containing protein [Bacteroidota bacterium]